MAQPSSKTAPTRSKPTIEGAYMDFMSRTYALEHEAKERYAQFAKRFEANGNNDCALLFRQLAEIEDRHARQILIKMGWTSPPEFAGEDAELPRSARFESVHEQLQPLHAVELALRREVGAQKYFEQIASSSAPQRVRSAAAEMATEERAHAKLIEYWLARIPRPISSWK